MTKWDAGVIETNGQEIPVQVDDRSGDWTAEYAGQRLSYVTREKLANRLKTLTKKTQVAIEIHVIRIQPYNGRGEVKAVATRGKLTGLHAGTGNVLAEWTVRGEPVKEQIKSWGQSGVIYVGGDTPDAELNRYGKLLNDLAQLQNEKLAWEKAYKVEPKGAVEKAVAARFEGLEEI